MLKDFSLKFVDVMIGVVLGVGFQWWPELKEPWQYLAFVFVYLNLVDYWIDYSPMMRTFPIKREIDVIIHTFIVFTMFLLIYSTTQSINQLLIAFILYRVLDITWIWRMKTAHHASSHDLKFVHGWRTQDLREISFCVLLLGLSIFFSLSAIWIILLFAAIRLLTRIFASLQYKALYYQ